jgi:predicted alpha/beta-hydrolase family hydrolase
MSPKRVAKRASTRRFRLDVGGDQSVSAIVQRPTAFVPGQSPGLVLAHGAGNDMHSPFLTYLAGELAADILTMRFNFPYTEQGRRAPDPAPRLEAAYRAAITALLGRAGLGPQPLVIGGKSMGGRIASHLAAAGQELAGLVFLGYPLHPAGKPDQRRDAHLPTIRCPMLFIQGARDRLCDLDLLRPVLQRLAAPHHLHVIDEGDHSFHVPKRTGRTDTEIWDEIRAVITDWLRDVVAR